MSVTLSASKNRVQKRIVDGDQALFIAPLNWESADFVRNMRSYCTFVSYENSGLDSEGVPVRMWQFTGEFAVYALLKVAPAGVGRIMTHEEMLWAMGRAELGNPI